MTRHQTNQTCPICTENQVDHVHCAHPQCEFVVTTCPKCDKRQVVDDFVKDHEDDCRFGPTIAIPQVNHYFSPVRQRAR